jgi:hypothetical protein
MFPGDIVRKAMTNLRDQAEIIGPDVYRTVKRSSSALKRG